MTFNELLLLVKEKADLRPRDTELLRLCFFSNPSDDEVRRFVDSIDINAERISFLLLLDHLCRRIQYRGLSIPLRNKLQGVRRFYSTRNTVIMAELVKTAKRLQAADIPVMLCKGAAIKLGYSEHSTRLMLDADIVVPEKFFRAAGEIMAAAGTGFLKTDHSTDFENGIDLHFILYKNSATSEREKGIWERAETIEAFGVPFLLPCLEDVIVLLLCNELNNLLDYEATWRVKWLFDLCWLAERNRVDWDRVAAIARELNVSASVLLMLRFAKVASSLSLPLPLLEEKLAGDAAGAELDSLVCRYELGKANEAYDRILAARRSLPVQGYFFWRVLRIEFRLFRLRNGRKSLIEFLCRRWQCDSFGHLLREFGTRLVARIKHSDPRFRKMMEKT